MLLVTGHLELLPAVIQQAVDKAQQTGRRVGVLACTEHKHLYKAEVVYDCGPYHRPEIAAQSLYTLLRDCDDRGLGFIVAEGYPEQGMGAALMNRLRKAAGGNEVAVTV